MVKRNKKIKNIGTTINRISICINEKTLLDIVNEIVQELNNAKKTKKVKIVKFIEIIHDKKRIELSIGAYIKRLQWTTLKKKSEDKNIRGYVDCLDRIIPKDMLTIFKRDFLGANLSRYIRFKPCLQEQGRKKAPTGFEEDSAIVRGNIFFEFDVENYKDFILDGEDKIKPMDYFVTVLKMLLFLDLKDIIRNFLNKPINDKKLINKIQEKLNDAIVTGLEVTDTLSLKKYRFEDIYYELAQLNFKSEDNIISNCPSKQSLRFLFKELKKYPTIYTKEQIKKNKIKKQERIGKKIEATVRGFVESEVEEAYDNFQVMEAEKLDIDLEDFLFEDINDVNSVDDYEPTYRNNKNKYKINISLTFQESEADNGTKIAFRISGAKKIDKLLHMYGEDSDEPIHLDTAIKRLNLKGVLGRILDGGLTELFNEVKETQNNFKNVKKSTFSIDLDFIQNNINGERYVIAKTILTILAYKDKSLRNKIKKQLKEDNKNELESLIRNRKAEARKRKNKNKEKAISILYKYNKDRINDK